MKIASAEFRITIGALGILWVLAMGILDAVLDGVTLNESIAIGIIGFSSGLLSYGLVKNFSKAKVKEVGE